MITVETVCKLVLENNAPYIRITDINKNLLYAIGSEADPYTKEAASERLKECLAYFSQCGKVIVVMATEKHFKSNYAGAYKYDVKVSTDAVQNMAGVIIPKQQDSISQFKDMLGVMMSFQALMGGNNNSSDAKLKEVEGNYKLELTKLEFQKQIDDLKRKQEEKDKQGDIWKILGPTAPLALSAMGKTTTEIKEIMGLAAMGTAMNPSTQTATMAGPNLTTDSPVTDLEELKKLSEEKLGEKIVELMQQIATKVEAAPMIQILQIINAKPTIVPRAIEAYKNGLL